MTKEYHVKSYAGDSLHDPDNVLSAVHRVPLRLKELDVQLLVGRSQKGQYILTVKN